MPKTIHIGRYTIEEMMDYLRIDIYGLDKEILEQPWLFGLISDALVTSQDERDSLKDELERTEAAKSLEIRRRYEEEGVSYTESKIKAEVSLDEDVVELKEDYQEAKTMVSRISSLKEAYETRARMLGHLARLYVADYFGSNPSTQPVDSNDAKEIRARQGRAAVSSTRRPLRRIKTRSK